jgi:hypothetical protein
MPLLENSETVAQMIRDGLRDFAAAHPRLPAARAVVWFEPEHDHCGLYISTDAVTPKLLPAEFDFPNFAVADAVVQGEYREHREAFWRETEQLVRSVSRELPGPINPKLWAVQIGFEHYNEWERSDDISTPVASPRAVANTPPCGRQVRNDTGHAPSGQQDPHSNGE